MYDKGSSPLEATTPHHLLDGFLAARAEMMPEDILARDREAIEWFRAFLVSRDEAGGRLSSPDELAARRGDRHGPVPHDLLAAQRVMLEIRKVLAAGSPPAEPALSPAVSARLVLRLLARWMLHRRLINESESRLIDQTALRYGLPPPTQRGRNRLPGTVRRRR